MLYWTLTIHGDSDIMYAGEPFEDEQFNFQQWNIGRFIEIINSYSFYARKGKESSFEYFEKYKKDFIKFLHNHKVINPEICHIQYRIGGNQYYEIQQYNLPEDWDD